MSGMADISPKVEPPEWLWLVDDPSKIGPPDWLPLNNAYRRRCDCLGENELARRDLYAWLCGPLPSAVRRINSNGNEAGYLLGPAFWEQIRLWLDADHLGIHYLDRSHSFDGREYFFVRADVFERLCSIEASAPAPPPTPSTEPKRILRRRQTKHDWDAICGETARLCHDESGLVRVPENESELADKVFLFCQNDLGCEPAPSELRKTVSVICAALRNVIPGGK
jgi:hypothetical protein